jgi:hypothetical protein
VENWRWNHEGGRGGKSPRRFYMLELEITKRKEGKIEKSKPGPFNSGLINSYFLYLTGNGGNSQYEFINFPYK